MYCKSLMKGVGGRDKSAMYANVWYSSEAQATIWVIMKDDCKYIMSRVQQRYKKLSFQYVMINRVVRRILFFV